MNLRKYVPPTKRHPALQQEHVVRKLLDAHAELSMNQAIHQTAMRFGISESQVMQALKGGDFFVKVK